MKKIQDGREIGTQNETKEMDSRQYNEKENSGEKKVKYKRK